MDVIFSQGNNLVCFRIELFNALYRRVLCRNRLNDDQLTVTSLQALAKVYRRYYEEIGYFSDMPYILQMLDRVSLGRVVLSSFDNRFYFFPVSIARFARCIDWFDKESSSS